MIGIKEKAIFWIGLCVAVIFFLCAVSNILLPFIVALLVAYFLDPAADKLETVGLSRSASAATIILGFFGVVIILAAFVLPALFDQFAAFVAKFPDYVAWIEEKYGYLYQRAMEILPVDSEQKAKEIISSYSGNILKVAGDILGNIVQSGGAFLNMISLIFISPIVSFFLLRDWDRITAKIDSWFPRDNAKVIREQLSIIDQTLSGFIRGQSNVCLMLAVFYGAGLSFVGLEFGMFIGIATGILAFLPYVGMFIGMTAGIIVALFQYGGDIQSIGAVIAVYVVGQFIEGNFVTPKLVGDKVGLHPVWIIFGLLAGGSLFGFVGVLIAIPVTAVVGVLSRFAVGLYINGGLYGSKKTKKTAAKKSNKKG